MTANAELAHRFVGSYTGTDICPHVEDLFAPTVSVWHNYDAQRQDIPGPMYARAMMWKVGGCAERIPDYADRVDHLHVATDAIVVAARATGTLPDGSPLDVPRCLILSVEDGRIARVDSYGDRAHHSPLDEILPYDEMFKAIGHEQ
ncbi:MAG: hypothetical protein QOE89_3213 [Pseudonocardiales bacterium]|jgi:ketosteroid isomerase-like protein|nr:hypothetical protein [Pseudonocardiales bacterium]